MDDLMIISNDLMNEEFNSLETSRERIEYALNQIKSIQELRLIYGKNVDTNRNQSLKSVDKSQRFRRNGNRCLQKNVFEYAIYWYSRAILVAPYPSDDTNPDGGHHNELCIAYTSRSLVFYQMEEYSNALFDIDCALQLSGNTSLTFSQRVELMRHKVLCLWQTGRHTDAICQLDAIIEVIPTLPSYNKVIARFLTLKDTLSEHNCDESCAEDNTQSDYELNMNYSQDIDHYISEDIELIETEDKGRHYKTKAAIKKETIIMIERSIGGVLYSDKLKTHCQYCFKNLGYKYWPCVQCREVVFCDADCAQKADHFHRYECGLIDIILSQHTLYRILLLIGPQMAIDLQKGVKNPLEVYEESDENAINYLKFIQLRDHIPDTTLKQRVVSTVGALHLALILDTLDDFRATDETFKDYLVDLASVWETLHHKLSVNAFGMYEMRCPSLPNRDLYIGNSVCFTASFFNHSCCCNCFWVFFGKHITIKTNRPIEAGDELTICYGPNHMSKDFDERQEFLKSRYHFDCKCCQCVKEESRPTDEEHIPSQNEDSFDSTTQLVHCLSGDDIRNSIISSLL